MLSYTTELYGRLQSGLHQIKRTPEISLKKAEEAYRSCAVHLGELKEYISGYDFVSKEEEVRFFKEVKPRFLKEMLFYLKLLQIESRKPLGSAGEIKDYYQQQIREIQGYIEKNQQLYLYMKLEKTHLDERIFVRDPEEALLLPHYSLEGDNTFSNAYSFKLAKLQASEELATELSGALQTGTYSFSDQQSHQGPPPLVWVGSQAQFYEAVLGFVKTGVLGEVSVKSAMEWLGYCFGVNTGHYYRYFQAMRIRKKSRVPFLKKCMQAVERWMDECDENPKFH